MGLLGDSECKLPYDDALDNALTEWNDPRADDVLQFALLLWCMLELSVQACAHRIKETRWGVIFYWALDTYKAQLSGFLVHS